MSERLERFALHGRVRVIEPRHPMHNETGVVVRLRKADDGAWVDMDRDLPPDLRTFPPGESRSNHTLLYPDDCADAETDDE